MKLKFRLRFCHSFLVLELKSLPCKLKMAAFVQFDLVSNKTGCWWLSWAQTHGVLIRGCHMARCVKMWSTMQGCEQDGPLPGFLFHLWASLIHECLTEKIHQLQKCLVIAQSTQYCCFHLFPVKGKRALHQALQCRVWPSIRDIRIYVFFVMWFNVSIITNYPY